MINLLITIVALVIIVKMADIFVDQAIAFSQRLKISGFLLGFLLISLGTTLPEISTSLYSTAIGHPEVAIASVIGCNITNILLVLGTLALLKKFKLKRADANFNIPLLLTITSATLLVVIINSYLISPFIGILFLIIFILVILLIHGNNHVERRKSDIKFNIYIFLGSLVLIPIFSKLCVDSLLKFATSIDIPEVLIVYFLLAFGASLPELATLYSSLKKGREDIGLGNIIGSSMFHLLFILGTASIIAPLDLSNFKIELLFVLVATILLFIFGLRGKKYFLSKREGLVLISFYFLFVLIQLLKAW